MNTTALITHWSMEGTMRDLLPSRREDPAGTDPVTVETAEPIAEAPARVDGVMVRRTDDDEWQPLAVGH